MARVADADAVKAKDLPPTERTSIMFSIPAELKAKIDDAAEGKGQSVAALVRTIVADHFEYVLPDIQRGGARKKYANDEEREAARKEKAEARRVLVNNLMKLYKSGKMDPEMLAALQADEDDDDEDSDDTEDGDDEE